LATSALNIAYGPSALPAIEATAAFSKFVVISPGSTMTTLTPNPATSKRRASDNASTAYFVAWYAPPPGNTSRPPMDEMLTMRPLPRARMVGRTSWHIRTSPKTLVSNCRRTSSRSSVSTAPDCE